MIVPQKESKMEEIWLEKYRPKTLDQVHGNDDIVEKLKSIAKNGNIPNMILVGPPGIGKTSSILCLAREILKDQLESACIELNASDERGIDVVRDKIKSFAQKKVNLHTGQHKIVILDEADSLTEGAQQALRMIISDFANTTRFVLSCNDSSKLIDAIQSRCAILRFTKLSDEQILKRILQIIDLEGIKHEDKGLEALIFTAEGDMRQAINNLQATFAGFNVINESNVFLICDVPNVKDVKKIIDNCIKGQFTPACLELQGLWKEGYTAYDLANTIFKVIQNHQMDKVLQYEFIKEMTVLKMRILEGLPTFLQISGFLAKLCQLSKNHIKNIKQ